MEPKSPSNSQHDETRTNLQWPKGSPDREEKRVRLLVVGVLSALFTGAIWLYGLVAEFTDSSEGLFFLVFGASAILAVAMLPLVIGDVLTRQRVLHDGMRTTATVLGLAHRENYEVPYGTDLPLMKTDDVWVIRYRYAAGSGEFVGASPTMDYKKARAWRVGDQVAITYDPANPALSIWLDERHE